MIILPEKPVNRAVKRRYHQCYVLTPYRYIATTVIGTDIKHICSNNNNNNTDSTTEQYVRYDGVINIYTMAVIFRVVQQMYCTMARALALASMRAASRWYTAGQRIHAHLFQQCSQPPSSGLSCVYDGVTRALSDTIKALATAIVQILPPYFNRLIFIVSPYQWLKCEGGSIPPSKILTS